uniref:BTB domain-containing protein n=1 Tax=Serinus canaria TaxID=9135 RepID=A0A8C9KVU1_SERCA
MPLIQIKSLNTVEHVFLPLRYQYSAGEALCCSLLLLSSVSSVQENYFLYSVITFTRDVAKKLGPQTEMIADTILEVGERLFQVSRRVLSVHSRYFEAMFFGGARESSEQHIVIKGIDAVPFHALLEFTRTAKVLIGQENVTSLLETADFFQFDRVKLLCEKFLERELHVSNCLGLMTYSQHFAFTELYVSAMNVALTHWGDVICQEEFKALPKEMLVQLLKSDDLFISREDVVFDSIMIWIMEDPATREEEFLDLVGEVRVTFLSLSFLDILVKRSKCAGETDIFSRLIKKLDSCPPPSWQNPKLCPYTGRSYDTLYVLGGKHDKEQQELFLFQPKTGTWQACSPLQRKNLTQYAVAAVGNLQRRKTEQMQTEVETESQMQGVQLLLLNCCAQHC